MKVGMLHHTQPGAIIQALRRHPYQAVSRAIGKLFSLTGIREKPRVPPIINFDTIHFQLVQPYKTYPEPDFCNEIISIFRSPDKTNGTIKDLMSPNRCMWTDLNYLTRVLQNLAKADPMFELVSKHSWPEFVHAHIWSGIGIYGPPQWTIIVQGSGLVISSSNCSISVHS